MMMMMMMIIIVVVVVVTLFDRTKQAQHCILINNKIIMIE